MIRLRLLHVPVVMIRLHLLLLPVGMIRRHLLCLPGTIIRRRLLRLPVAIIRHRLLRLLLGAAITVLLVFLAVLLWFYLIYREREPSFLDDWQTNVSPHMGVGLFVRCAISFYSHYYEKLPSHRATGWDEEGAYPLVYRPNLTTASGGGANHLVLVWTPYKLPYLDLDTSICPTPYNVTCQITHDKTQYKRADAIIFHYFLMHLFADDFPPTRSAHQRYVAYIREPPTITALLPYSHFRNVFNWTASYRLDSDIYAPYYNMEMVMPGAPTRDYAAGKTRLLAIFTSRFWLVHSSRPRVIRILSSYLPLDVYSYMRGKVRCSDNGTELVGYDIDCLTVLRRDYKFYLAFENSMCRDYVSERFFRALSAGVVPVVLGGGCYSRIVPRSAYISLLDFPSIRHLADHLLKIDADDALYNKYFDWRRDPQMLARNTWYHPKQNVRWVCDVCAKLDEREAPHKVVEDLEAWWHGGQCLYPRWKRDYLLNN